MKTSRGDELTPMVLDDDLYVVTVAHPSGQELSTGWIEAGQTIYLDPADFVYHRTQEKEIGLPLKGAIYDAAGFRCQISSVDMRKLAAMLEQSR